MPSHKDRQPEQTGQRDAHGRFLPGNHNGGRPKEYRAFKERCAEFMDAEGFALLSELARQPNEFALKLLAEYAYGKPQQQLLADVEHHGGVTIYLPQRTHADSAS